LATVILRDTAVWTRKLSLLPLSLGKLLRSFSSFVVASRLHEKEGTNRRHDRRLRYRHAPARTPGRHVVSGGNVDRNQFQPIYFDFDSQTIRSSENGKIQQIAGFLQQNNRPDHHRRIHR
jgi:outer membrane protein OmpA-like peptidoglycan-associated protein